MDEVLERDFDQLFKEHFKPAVLFARNYTADIDSAQEIVQAVFVKIYEKRSELAISGSFKAYLYTSIRNTALNNIKQMQTRQAIEVAQASSDEVSIFEASETEMDDRWNALEKAIAELPTQCGNIFRLSRFKQLKNKEIAEQLGISIRTVETQISKALRILRERFKS